MIPGKLTDNDVASVGPGKSQCTGRKFTLRRLIVKRWQCVARFDQTRCNDLRDRKDLDSTNPLCGVDIRHRGIRRTEIKSDDKTAG
jgi:hypothetical protein